MNTRKKAIITGITGQDGSYLAELLLEKDYDVYGLVRRSSTFNTERIEHIYLNDIIKDNHNKQRLHLLYGDMTDSSNITKLLSEIRPDEIYNLAAQSHVQVSFQLPEYTTDADALGVLRILEGVRLLNLNTRIYQASTSELFGLVQEIPQSENTPFYPRSPYAAAKLYGYWIVRNYREAYNMYACNGILFNHESPRRGETFVTRKITLAAVRIMFGQQEKLYLGNLDSKRDWGFAPDYVEAMWLMLQLDKPEDLVIATGETHTVREFCELAFKAVGITIIWEGSGINEKGLHKETGEIIIEIDPKYFRPTEVEFLLGNPSMAVEKLGWNPTKTPFDKLVKIMIDSDLDYVKKRGEVCV